MRCLDVGAVVLDLAPGVERGHRIGGLGLRRVGFRRFGFRRGGLLSAGGGRNGDKGGEGEAERGLEHFFHLGLAAVVGCGPSTESLHCQDEIPAGMIRSKRERGREASFLFLPVGPADLLLWSDGYVGPREPSTGPVSSIRKSAAPGGAASLTGRKRPASAVGICEARHHTDAKRLTIRGRAVTLRPRGAGPGRDWRDPHRARCRPVPRSGSVAAAMPASRPAGAPRPRERRAEPADAPPR